MSFGYNYYVQKYPVGSTKYSKVDIEQKYNCKVQKVTNATIDGDVKNVYAETFAESSIPQVYLPDNVARDTTSVTLKIKFYGAQCANNAKAFSDYISGVKCEYSDTMRNRYVTFLMTDKTSVEDEQLYKGAASWQIVNFTLTNIYGESFLKSQIS